MKKTSLVMATLAAFALSGCGIHAPGAMALQRAAVVATAKADPARFFANSAIERQAPEAFALQPEAHDSLQEIESSVKPARDALITAVRKDKVLAAQVAGFDKLSWDAQVPVIKQVVALEAKVMGFQAPPLVIQEGPNQIPSFFEFDVAVGGTGKVILYPASIAQEADKFAALMLAVHEVRHSGQFQLSQARNGGALGRGFKAAFKAQHDLKGKLSFCDFCSLLNEYEAFQAGNYVVGTLTNWQADQRDMGCLSSQYDAKGQAKIDLWKLSAQVGPAKLLEAFNDAEKPQFGGR
ncbi:MAG: hypothetical protein JWM80_856 [Cyanobacteria bacterium RYN_339]|nr:hypothetical protein [Cyanobacteria bacterium RYN_339]